MTPTDLHKEQLAILKELGTRLHQLRMDRKGSIVALANETKIQRRLLKAIEVGDLEELPEPVYVRSLLKHYADALGLDGAEFASAFPVELNQPKKRSFSFALPFLRLRPFHLYFLYVLIVFVTIKGLASFLRRSSPQDQPQLVIVEPPPPQPSPLPPQSQPSLSVSSSEPNEPVVVDILLKDQCWLQVSADGKTVFEGILPKGTRRTWTAEKQVKLRAGNAGGVVVTYNDQQAQRLGAPGEVEEVVYQAPEL